MATLYTAQFYLGNVLQAERLAILVAGDDDVAVFLGRLQTTFIAHGVFKSHVALLTKLTRGSLDVLLGQGGGDV